MQADDRLAIISAIFSCPKPIACLLDGALAEQHFAHGAHIAHQGEPCAHCWLVLDGRARIQCFSAEGQKVQLAVHGPGEIFGAYPSPTSHRADIIADGTVKLLRMGCSELVGLVTEHAALGAGLSRLLARQLDMALDRMAARNMLTAAGRVYAELLRLAGTANRISPPPVLTAFAMTVQTTRETASRAISALERRGIVKRDESALTIVSPRMLADMII